MKEILESEKHKNKEKDEKKMYKPSQKRTEERDVTTPIQTKKSTTVNDSDNMNPTGEKSGTDEDAVLEKTLSPVAKHPYDSVQPVPWHPIPRNGAIAISEVAGRMRNVDPHTDTLQLKKGPHTQVEFPTSEDKRTDDLDD
ncbi:hypothetical protein L218DRAFT_996536 [Marasmius fiardii PR-910]|nr:hypothetical protein L218DRAFT_996536 [Marasmius fiardii PR-910]